MSFPRYPAYKPSGVKWLGEVPEHWGGRKLKNFSAFTGGGTPSRENLSFWNGSIPWVSPKDMKVEKISQTEESITQEGLSESSSTLIEPGCVLVVVRSGILRHTIPVAMNAVRVALNQDMKALLLDKSICSSSFFVRWIQGLNDQLVLAWAKQGATVESIEQNYLGNQYIPLPPLREQSLITSFLDRETAKIDALIVEQQRLIELLQEKRQAVISHAVTKGLNPNAPMKDSGVEWLGEVPEHWITGKLCYYARLDTGSTPDRQRPEYWNGDIPWVKTGEVRYEDIRETEEKITELALQETSCSLQQPGTLLMALYGQGVTRGRVGMLITAASCNQACAAITPSPSIDGRYLELYLTNAYSHLRSLGNESIQQNLNLDFVGKLELLVPPLAEQECI
jgi:type I restriction enzyme S subunit